MTPYSAPDPDSHRQGDRGEPQPSEKELALAAYWAVAEMARRYPSFRHEAFLDHAREILSDAAAADPKG